MRQAVECPALPLALPGFSAQECSVSVRSNVGTQTAAEGANTLCDQNTFSDLGRYQNQHLELALFCQEPERGLPWRVQPRSYRILDYSGHEWKHDLSFDLRRDKADRRVARSWRLVFGKYESRRRNKRGARLRGNYW